MSSSRPGRFLMGPSMVVLLLGLAAAAEPAEAQSTSLASFTTAQADSGRAAFGRTCVTCHGEDLSGVAAPPLVGPSFAYSWDGKFVNGLMAFVQSSMPLMNPGTLDERTAVILVAYILSANGVVAGPTPLTRSATDVIVLPGRGVP